VNEHAWILTSSDAAGLPARLSCLLQFFGVEPQRGTAAEFITRAAGANRIFGTVGDFVDLLTLLAKSDGGMRLWKERVHSAFLQINGESDAFANFLRQVSPGSTARLVRISSQQDWRVTDALSEICGPMRGVCFSSGKGDPEWGVVEGGTAPDFAGIISSGDVAPFLRIVYEGVPIFIVTTSAIVDLDAPVGDRGFDIRDSWVSALPAVMYVRWAFPDSTWKAREHSACLIIDDPLLKPRYGFVDFEKLLKAMQGHRFSTNIAFIPWNWRRSRRSVVQLFRDHPKEYSLSVHGCDHTAGEFGSVDASQLQRRLQTAVTRMDGHAASTGVQHHRVMVFPQGVFSTTAMSALKRNDFVAAVNTEVMSVDAPARPLRVADVWDVAIMSYDGFPIFTRRYPWQEVSNFAFDVLLGKPCLIVIHHDFCRDRNSHLIEFIDRLNAQIPSLVWRGLGDVLQNSYRWRRVGMDCEELEMYAGELLLQNSSSSRSRYRIKRRNSEPAGVREVTREQTSIPWSQAGDYLQFETTLEPGEQKLVRVAFQAAPVQTRDRVGIKYRVKTAVRRYLSEFRDDYVTPMRPAHIPLGKTGGK
jgi:hypothetical protein